MAAVECPNHEVNLQMCPGPSEDCENKGICCLCVRNHAGKGGKTSCMRGAERPAESRSLSGVATGPCAQFADNKAFCPCDYDACANGGTCCDCIRNHWGNAVYPSPACMR
ncbi:MAG: hypothetical protein ACODAJ_09835 [Planctomycetota bacterium]